MAWSHGNYSSFLTYKRKEYDKAIDAAETALSIMNYGMARKVLGYACMRRGNQLQWDEKNNKDAIPYYEKALKHMTPNSNLHYSLGMAYYKLGHASKNRKEIELAAAHLQKAFDLDPEANEVKKHLKNLRKLIDWMDEKGIKK